jgi:hypothetical protein
MSKLTVRKAQELVGIEAKPEFYELNPEAKYLIVLPAPVTSQTAERIQRIFKEFGIDVLVGDGSIRIFEF